MNASVITEIPALQQHDGLKHLLSVYILYLWMLNEDMWEWAISIHYQRN